MIVLAALAGAMIALAVREFVEHLDRVKEKRANCYHDFYETKWNGHITRHCRKCGFQEHGDKE